MTHGESVIDCWRKRYEERWRYESASSRCQCYRLLKKKIWEKWSLMTSAMTVIGLSRSKEEPQICLSKHLYQQIFQISPQALHVQAVHQWGVQRDLGYRLKVSSRRGDSYNCLLQYQRQLPSTRYFSQIRLWVQSERCITLFVMWIELWYLITNRMYAQDLYRECDREKRRCLDSL